MNSVDNSVIVELKAVSETAPIYRAKLLAYLKLSTLNLGLLINFNTLHLKDGIFRMVNDLSPASPCRPCGSI